MPGLTAIRRNGKAPRPRRRRRPYLGSSSDGSRCQTRLNSHGCGRAVVPLMGARHAVVDELVADRLPGLAAVVGALDHLTEPAARLRGVEAVRVDGRALEVVDLPAPKCGPLTSQRSRLPSDVRTNAPLRVPTSNRTPLIPCSFATRVLPMAGELLRRLRRARPATIAKNMKGDDKFRRNVHKMAKKPIKGIRQRSNLDDPKGQRRSADSLEGSARLESVRRIKSAQYRAGMDPKTRRPKR